MRKWISMALALLLVFSLVACGSDGNSGSTPSLSEQNGNQAHDSMDSDTSGREDQNGSSAVMDEPSSIESSAKAESESMPIINIQVGDKSFSMMLFDNDSARALLEQMPLTLDMSELNGNEKYYYFSDALPAASQQVGNVNAGDLMLYGSDCLVLFYESFSTSYSYTKLGYIEDASGLADALGQGSVQVAFAISDS